MSVAQRREKAGQPIMQQSRGREEMRGRRKEGRKRGRAELLFHVVSLHTVPAEPGNQSLHEPDVHPHYAKSCPAEPAFE